MAILNLLLNCLLIVLPLGVLLRFQLAPDVFFYPHDIILFAVSILLGLNLIKTKKLLFPRISHPLIYFFIFAFISLLLNSLILKPNELFVSFLYLLRVINYSSLLFVFPLLKDKTNNYYNKLAIAGFVFVLLGIVQYFFYNNLANLRYLNWDIHLYRLFSTILDPNFAGAIVVIEILLLLGLLFKKRTGKTQIIISLSLFVSLVAMLLTYSRSTLIAFAAAMITFFVLNKKLKLLTLFVFIFLLSVIIIPKDSGVEGMNLLRTGSSVGRITSFSSSFVVFSSSPIYGVGFNAYRYAQNRLGLLDINWLTTHAGAGVSNSYLFVLATTGLIGLLLFMFFLFRLFKFIMEIKPRSNTAIVGAAALVGVLAHSLFDNTFFYPFVMVWLFFLLGVAFSTQKNTK